MNQFDTPPAAANAHCSQCGTPFICGFSAGAAECWCMNLAISKLPVPAAASGMTCWCPNCLTAASKGEKPD